MTNRMLVAGLLGALAMFIWTSIAHMALPLGEAGIAEIPNESAVLGAMRSNIGRHASLYVFPGLGLGPHPSREAKSAALKGMVDKLANNPSGFLMYHPAGSRAITLGRLLGVEFLTELVEVLIAVFLLSLTRLHTFGGRTGFITLAGILAALATNISYWNWYGFPSSYTAAYIFTQIIGFLCAGLLIALVLKNQQPVSVPVPL